jgi:hypothetical protein
VITGLNLVGWGAAFALGVDVLILLPLSAFGRTRMAAGLGIWGTSWLFGFNLSLISIFFIYAYWGLFPILLGLLFLWIGVVPIAIAATIWHADWSAFGVLAEWVALALAARFIGLWIAHKGEQVRKAGSPVFIGENITNPRA